MTTIEDAELERGLAEAKAQVAVTEALRPLAPESRADVLCAVAVVYGDYPPSRLTAGARALLRKLVEAGLTQSPTPKEP